MLRMAALLVIMLGLTTLLWSRQIPPMGVDVTLAKSLIVHPTAQLPPIIRLRRITAYNPVENQTDSSPSIASCGPNLPHQVALSQDLFFRNGKKLCGIKVAVYDNNGKLLMKGIVWDTMNPRYTKAVDILLKGTTKAFKFGVHTGYLVF